MVSAGVGHNARMLVRVDGDDDEEDALDEDESD